VDVTFGNAKAIVGAEVRPVEVVIAWWAAVAIVVGVLVWVGSKLVRRRKRLTA
jgi:hypothetical protein